MLATMSACGHPLCELIGGSCSLVSGRSRGCTAAATARSIAPEVFDEVRELLGAIERDASRDAAIRLAAIIRREARDDRHLVALARDDEPELVPALERLCGRRSR